MMTGLAAAGMGVCVLPAAQYAFVPIAPGYARRRAPKRKPRHDWRAAVTNGMRSQTGSSVILKISDYRNNGYLHGAIQCLASSLFGTAGLNTWKRSLVTLPHSMQ